MIFDKDINIIIKGNYIFVYLKKELFLRQGILKNPNKKGSNLDYTFLFITLILQRFGLASCSHISK
jgi:hypothetical protein